LVYNDDVSVAIVVCKSSSFITVSDTIGLRADGVVDNGVIQVNVAQDVI
jgi:hypothetical protein